MSAYTDAAQNVKDLTGASIENVVGAGQNMLGQFLDYKMYKDLLGVNPVKPATSLPTVDLSSDMKQLGLPTITNPLPDQGLSYGVEQYNPGIYDFTKPATENKYNFTTGK
jgi:hypothetical protein